jgi:hypothetical protein
MAAVGGVLDVKKVARAPPGRGNFLSGCTVEKRTRELPLGVYYRKSGRGRKVDFSGVL